MNRMTLLAASAVLLSLSLPAAAQTNTSTAHQLGDDNSATVTQLQPTSSNTNNSLIEQGDIGNSLAGSHNEATVTQGGPSWDFGTPQDANNTSQIHQKDNYNKAEVSQTGTLGLGLTNTSTVDQTGTGSSSGEKNEAKVIQDGRGTGNNKSDVTQVGNTNLADVKQLDVYGMSHPAVPGNLSAIDQQGTNNTADVDQGGIANFAGGPGANKNNASSVVQTGDWNSASVTQDGKENASVNDSVIAQSGDGASGGEENVATVDQSDFANNFSSINQDGNTNQATVAQGGSIVVTNDSAVVLAGSGNTSTVTQH